MIRKIALLLIGFALGISLYHGHVGGGAEMTRAEAVADIRERAPALTHKSDDELVTLMRMSCAMMDQTGDLGSFPDLAVRDDLDPFDLGVVVGNAIRSLCPEYVPQLEAYSD